MLPDTLHPGAALRAALGQLLGLFGLGLASKYRRQAEPNAPELPTSSSVPLTRPEPIEVAGRDVAPAPKPASAQLAPVVAIISQIPVAGPLLAAPIKLGAALADALGINGPAVFDPCKNPADSIAPIIYRVFQARVLAYNPASGRFDNPEPLPVDLAELEPMARATTTAQDGTGILLGPDERAKAELWRKQLVAARAVNYDRSRAEADGFTLKAATPAPPTSPAPTSNAQINALLQQLHLPAPTPAAAAPLPAPTSPAPAQVASQTLSLFASARAVAFPRTLEP